MSRLPELSYALTEARPTALLSQFSSILNLADIFGPLLPLDAAITFYAPLRSSLADLRGAPASFERTSEALYLRNNRWRIALDNNPRFSDGGLLMETAVTNKCTNYNAEPDAAETNILKSGAGTVTRIFDADLADSEIGDVNNGFCWEVDGTLGVTACTFQGSVGNLNVHTGSAWVKFISASGTSPFLRIGTTGAQAFFTNTDWQRIHLTEATATAGDELRLECPTGAIARVVFNQLEESPSPSSPIITRGTAGQRAADVLTYGGLTNFFNQPAGMALFTLRPGVPLQDTAGNRGLLNTRANNIGVAYHDDIAFKTNDGSNSRSVNHGGSVAGDVFYLATRWSDAPAELQIGFRKNGAAWAWSTVVAYDGAFLEEGELFLAPLIAFGYSFADVQLWREDRGTAWIEGNYPP